MLRFASLTTVFAFVVALAGCSTAAKPPLDTSGSNGAEPGSGQGGSLQDGGADGSCSFPASPSAFALPSIAGAEQGAFTEYAGQLTCPSGTTKLTYSVLDMNADGQPDLVVTSACDDAAVGVSVWLVYLNVGTGFSSTAIRYALAPASATGGCTTTSTTSYFDLTGDLIPDYVVTSLCKDATVGTSRWLVYPGGATGFAQTPTTYSLPSGYSAGAFATTSVAADVCAGGANVPAFSLIDLDGDGRLDLVVTEVCNDTSVGTTAWLAYLGTTSGVSPTAERFALPTTPAPGIGAFAAPTGSLSCTGGVAKPAFSLLDFDVDGKVDLVVTADCTQANVGTSAWLWYRNSGKSFAALPATLTLPTITGAPAGSFTSLAAEAKCANGGGAPGHTLADLDGDAILDLIVTRDCSSAQSGVSHWDVYPNTGAGFGSAPRSLAIPLALGATTANPLGLADALDCTAPASRPAFIATYLAGLRFDLVVTASCTDSTVGSTRWLLYPAACP